jgi:hypothetical protein
VDGVTRDELIEIVRRIEADPAGDDADHYLCLFGADTPHPRAVDLIFHPPAGLAGASPARIVDAALAYRPIAL